MNQSTRGSVSDFEKDVAPEENIDWLPQPEPTDGEAPAP